MSDEERLARAALGRLTEPADPRVSGLVADLGATAVYRHLQSQSDLGELTDEVSSRLQGINPERDLELAARLGIRFVIPGDPEWPHQLDVLDGCGVWQGMAGAPLGLWVRGPLPLNELQSSVAVVGSRSSTTYGGEVAFGIALAAAEAGYPVVSGAAIGIDYEAHRGALSADAPDRTVAVLACGVDRVYPAAHRNLLNLLAQRSAVISELPPGCAPMKWRFLSRNRIIAALSQVTVVVEAAIRSGALSTAHWAQLMSRPVLGVPGPVTSASSEGVNQLLRQGAGVVTGGAEVLEHLGRAGEHTTEDPRGPALPRDSLSRGEARVLEAVPVGRGASPETIARAAGLGLTEVRRCLQRLDELGMVIQREHRWLLAPGSRT